MCHYQFGIEAHGHLYLSQAIVLCYVLYIVNIYYLLQAVANSSYLTSRMSLVNLCTCLFIAGVVRLLLYVYGLWQDAAMAVKYTDIDYIVFTDAARFMTQVGDVYTTVILPLTVSCFSKIQIGFTFLVPAHQGSPGQNPESRKMAVLVVQLSS